MGWTGCQSSFSSVACLNQSNGSSHRMHSMYMQDSTFFPILSNSHKLKEKKKMYYSGISPPHENTKKKVSTHSVFGNPWEGHTTTSQPMSASECNPKLEVKLHRKIVNHGVEFSFSIPVLPPRLCRFHIKHLGCDTQRWLSLTSIHQ